MNMRVWVVGLVAVVALTGCGSEGGGSGDPSEAAPSEAAPSEAAAPTIDEWVDVALAECEEVNQATADAEPQGDPFSPDATDEDRQQGVTFLSEFSTSLEGFATSLEDLGYPDENTADAQALVEAAKASSQAFDAAATTAEDDFAKAQPAVGAAFGSVQGMSEAAKKVGIGDLENCKREGSKPEKVAAGANEVPVVATKKGDKYVFEFDKAVPAGKTAFVMANEDDEPHFMSIAEFTGPGALDKALKAEAAGDSKAADKFIVNEEVGGSKDAAPGEQAVANVELKPGTYGMLCFIPGPDGKPHAFSGMAIEFEVE